MRRFAVRIMALADLTDLREVPVDWRALQSAVENNAADVNSYLHLVSGAVLRLVDGTADPDVQARVAGSRDYMRRPGYFRHPPVFP